MRKNQFLVLIERDESGIGTMNFVSARSSSCEARIISGPAPVAIAEARSFKTLDDLFYQCAFTKKHHPGGWDYVESSAAKNKHPYFSNIRITVTKFGSFNDVALEVRPGVMIRKEAIIKHYGKKYSTVPMAPENFRIQSISYLPNKKTQLIFGFVQSGSSEILAEATIRKY